MILKLSCNTILSISIIVAAACFVYCYRHTTHTTRTGPDGVVYNIMKRENWAQSNKVLVRFAEIRKRVDALCNYCTLHNYPDYARASRMQQRWNRSRLQETRPTDKSVAYVVDKGREFSVCLTNKTTGELEDINSTMFVVLHEMGHLMSVSWGHNAEFWNNFKLILAQAHKLGIYDYTDYGDKPQEYCGISIYSNPCPNATCKTPKQPINTKYP